MIILSWCVLSCSSIPDGFIEMYLFRSLENRYRGKSQSPFGGGLRKLRMIEDQDTRMVILVAIPPAEVAGKIFKDEQAISITCNKGHTLATDAAGITRGADLPAAVFVRPANGAKFPAAVTPVNLAIINPPEFR